ncbi:cathepsin L-like [Acanthaster planci]|uniref:Cathepsin L-like n=1 Tax=Acanthaster planci TaxID=133434 RepID=A0A8B7ZRJ1_ACAPL|nr:cathepsin L-like [Acanthaster planci]
MGIARYTLWAVFLLFSREALGKLVGGWQYVDPDDGNIQKLARFAVDEINSRRNDYFKTKLVEIRQAQEQVVAGTLYRMNITIWNTLCTKSDAVTDLEDCKFNPKEKKERCTLSVLVVPWQKRRSLEGFDCTKETDKVFDSYPYYQEFEDFRQKFSRRYEKNDEEYVKRYYLFSDNMERVRVYNENERGTATYGATKFADLHPNEFKEMYTGLKRTAKSPPQDDLQQAKIPSGPTPASFDWRTRGAVTPVKNQGQCGSCWAFSTTGNIEGQWALAKGNLVSLSEQQLVDCDKVDEGCDGGLPSNAYQATIKMGGLETETEYPYKAEDEKCELDKKDITVYINSSVKISSNEEEMAKWTASNGPISIGINAAAMQFYFGGVSHPWRIFCNPKSLDHGVLIVGYGTKPGILWGKNPYWIIKNSWGADWGVNGYYLAYRGDGVCGLNTMCTSAVVN